MNHPAFDVLTEPWIPVVRLDGSCEEMGILRCLEEAHDLREIRDPSPIVEFGIHRLLVAFVLDALILADRRPEDPRDLKYLIEDRQFDSCAIESYVKHCGDVFDLFHPDRPFLQAPRAGKCADGPVEVLFAHMPCGSEPLHWHHAEEGHLTVSPAEAVRAMMAISPFMKQGGRGYSPSINGSSPLYAMPLGRSLFETLVFNLPLRSNHDSTVSAAWTRRASLDGRRAPVGIPDGLTWQPRKLAITVPGDPRSQISKLVFGPGYQAEGTSWIDPNLAYRWGDQGVEKVSMRRNRPLWRDAGALALLPVGELGRGRDKVSVRRPDVVEHALAVLDDSQSLHLRAYGLMARQASVYEWSSSELGLPTALGKSIRLGPIVERELQLADRVSQYLRSAILSLSPEFQREEKKPPTRRKSLDKRSIRSIADRCDRAYWQRLESHFHPLMTAFAALDPNAPDDPVLITTTAMDWRGAVRQLALEQFEFAAKDMDADGDALERQVRARSRLTSTLRRMLT